MTSMMNRCCVCEGPLKDTHGHGHGQTMQLHSLVQINFVKRVFEKDDVSMGSTLCGKCRANFYKKRAEEAKEELDQKSEEEDPTFHYVGRSERSQSTELVEMEFPRVVATHRYCFLCGSSERIITVPFQARQQTFVRKRIFVPKGNRCHSFNLLL